MQTLFFPSFGDESGLLSNGRNISLRLLLFLSNSDWYDELNCVDTYDDATTLMYMVMKGTLSSK